jgi:hypothetical protein
MTMEIDFDECKKLENDLDEYKKYKKISLP